MPAMTVVVDGTIPVAEDFNGNFRRLNQAIGTATSITTYATGDLLYASATDRLTRLAAGTSGQVLGMGASVPAWSDATTLAGMPRSYLAGLALSTNGADAAHDIDVAVGAARDDGNSDNLVLAGGLTKQIDAVWAVGTNAGGLDTGSVAGDSWYHVWLIKRQDTGVVDVLFSLSATDPSLPTSYEKKRRLGAVLTDSSANLLPFVQAGDEFRWNDETGALDFNTTTGTSANTVTHRVPTGVVVQAFGSIQGGTGTIIYVSSLDTPDLAPSASAWPLANAGFAANGIAAPWFCKTNTSGQCRWRAATNQTVRLATLGWVDRRGRDD